MMNFKFSVQQLFFSFCLFSDLWNTFKFSLNKHESFIRARERGHAIQLQQDITSCLQTPTMKTNIIFSIFLVASSRASAFSSLTSLEKTVGNMVERMEKMEAEMEAKDERIAALEAAQTRVDMGGWILSYLSKIEVSTTSLQVGGSVPGGRSGLGWRWTTATSPTSVCSSPRLGRRWRGPAWTSTPGSSPPPTRQSGLWATVQPPSSTAEILFRQHRLPSPSHWFIILFLWDFVGAPTTYPPTSCSSLILVISWVLESVVAGFHSHQRRKDWGLPVLGQLLRVRWSDLLTWLSYPSPPPGRWRHSLPHHWGRGTLRGLLRALVHHALCRTQTGRQLINTQQILYTPAPTTTNHIRLQYTYLLF